MTTVEATGGPMAVAKATGGSMTTAKETEEGPWPQPEEGSRWLRHTLGRAALEAALSRHWSPHAAPCQGHSFPPRRRPINQATAQPFGKIVEHLRLRLQQGLGLRQPLRG